MVAFFAFVILGHVFYSGGDITVSMAAAQEFIREAFQSGINWILYGVARLFGLIGVGGATLFVYVLQSDTVNGVLGSPVIDVIWTIVRDVLNLAFILILLFSAFATIFQVERYHLRNILVRLVIMALLVNFSLPIAKVIIDASNILMYFFVNTLFPKAASGTGFEIPEIFGKSTNIVDVFVPQKEVSGQTSGYIFIAIVFAFFYGISMITIAGILVVRLVALAILMIFSPIGFVAMVLPSTQTYAQKWWSNLFKYAFNGPILVFMLFFAMSFMAYTHDMAFRKDSDIRIAVTTDVATTDASQSSNMTNLAFLMIPVVILWAGIIMTNTASDGASQMVTNFGQNIVRRTGRGLRRGGRYLAVGAGRGVDYALGDPVRTRRQQFRNWRDRRNRLRDQRIANRAELAAAPDAARRAAVETRHFTNAVVEAEKQLEGLSDVDLANILRTSNDQHEQAAAARLLSKNGNLNVAQLRAITAPNGFGSNAASARILSDIENNLQQRNQRGTLAAYAAAEGRRFANNNEGNTNLGGNPNDSNGRRAMQTYLNVDAGALAQQNLGAVRNSEHIGYEERREHFDAIINNEQAARRYAQSVRTRDEHEAMQRESENYGHWTT